MISLCIIFIRFKMTYMFFVTFNFFVLTLCKKGKYPCIANIIATPKINLSEVEKTCEIGVTLNNEKKL